MTSACRAVVPLLRDKGGSRPVRQRPEACCNFHVRAATTGRGAQLAFKSVLRQVVFEITPPHGKDNRMTGVTLERVLTQAEALSREEQAMLEDLLRRRGVEAWRHETALDAKKATRVFRSGKLKSMPVEDVIAELRAPSDRA